MSTLPQLKPWKTNKYRDRTLSQLCVRSKEAWKAWNNEGRPETGPLYEAKSTLRRKVCQRVKFCASMEERKRIWQQEAFFRTNSHIRFSIPQKCSKSGCTWLRIDNTLVSDPSLLLKTWTHHFQELSKSQRETNIALKESFEQCTSLLSASYQKEEVFLDIAFSTEEVRQS